MCALYLYRFLPTHMTFPVHACGQSVIMSHSFAVGACVCRTEWVHVCVGQRRVIQYCNSALDQILDSIN
jgi:hypothetical protein